MKRGLADRRRIRAAPLDCFAAATASLAAASALRDERACRPPGEEADHLNGADSRRFLDALAKSRHDPF